MILGSGGAGRTLSDDVILAPSYSRTPITVVLSNLPEAAVEYGLAAIKNFVLGAWFFVLKRTLLVCPGVINIVSV